MSQYSISEDDSDLQDDLFLIELTEQFERMQSSSDIERSRRLQQLDIVLYECLLDIPYRRTAIQQISAKVDEDVRHVRQFVDKVHVNLLLNLQ